MVGMCAMMVMGTIVLWMGLKWMLASLVGFFS
jgi:hypothetical protein